MTLDTIFDVHLIARIDPLWFWGIFLSLCLFNLGFIVKFYKAILKARTLEDTPTAKIRSASQGYCELQGFQICLHNHPLTAPLSKLPCTWYKYQIEYYQDDRWMVIENQCSEGLFVLDDGTGICFVDPFGADVTTPEAKTWRGYKRYPAGLPKGFFAMIFGNTGPYRYTEWRMVDNMPLYAIGNFFTFSKQHFTTQHPTRQVSEFIQRWQQRTHHLFTGQTRKTITEQDIDHALELATQYMQKYADSKISEPFFNILTNVALDSRHPYVLSGFDPKKVIFNYKFDAFLWYLAFVITTSFTAWFTGIRLGMP